MKKILGLLFLCFPLIASAQDYPWDLTVFGGGAIFCEEAGCFGPSGFAVGGSFGRHFTDRWAFELEGTYARTSEIFPARFDPLSGIFFTPERVRRRFWSGFTFLGDLAKFGETSSLFISVGAALAYEHREEIAPEGVFAPDQTLGLKGGISGGAGMNLWFSEHWGFRPEVKFYLIATPLSGIRYTGGIMHRF